MTGSVGDLLLDNLPVVNVSPVYMQGATLFWAFMFLVLVYDPKRLPFGLKALGVFVLIHSAFVVMTHLGPYPDQVPIAFGESANYYDFAGSYFFSGHTGFPFLLALMFWSDHRLRGVFLASSFVFGASVLLGHAHYSIDVFAAFFMTYGIYHIARAVFAQDYALFLAEGPEFPHQDGRPGFVVRVTTKTRLATDLRSIDDG
jgi:hypothetical protein